MEQRDEGGRELERTAVGAIDQRADSGDLGPLRCDQVTDLAGRTAGGDHVLDHSHSLPRPHAEAPAELQGGPGALGENEARIGRQSDREPERYGAHGRAGDDVEVRVLRGRERGPQRAREPGALEEPELLHEDIGMTAGRQAEMPSLHRAGVVQGAADVGFVQVSTLTAPTNSETRATPWRSM